MRAEILCKKYENVFLPVELVCSYDNPSIEKSVG